MADDSRNSGRTDSGTVAVPSGNNTTQEVVPLDDEDTFSAQYLRVEYLGGSAASTLEVYDEGGSVAPVDLSDQREQFNLQGGENVVVEEATLQDFEDGVSVLADGSSDAEIVVTVGGVLVTS